MNFYCGGCFQQKPAADFYLKQKDKIAICRSDWSSRCCDCVKKYKKKYYETNSKSLNAAKKSSRLANHEEVLKQEAARRLERAKDPERILRRRSIQTLDPQRRYFHDRFLSWKASAMRRRIAWNLQEEDILDLWKRQAGLCYYLHEPLLTEPGSRQTLSLDRIDSAVGYSKPNIVLCGAAVNKMKLDLSLDELLAFSRKLIELHATP